LFFDVGKRDQIRPLSATGGATTKSTEAAWRLCQILCPDAFSYAIGKRSSNMMARWLGSLTSLSDTDICAAGSMNLFRISVASA